MASISDWSSSNNNIVRIDSNLGVGLVVASGAKFVEQVTITNGNAKTGNIVYDLEIRDADKIAFVKSSDVFNGEDYKGHLLIKNHLQIDKVSNLAAKNTTRCSNWVPRISDHIFTCKLTLVGEHQGLTVKALDVFKVNPIFDNGRGSYACEITLLTSINELVNLVKNLELNFELQVNYYYFAKRRCC